MSPGNKVCVASRALEGFHGLRELDSTEADKGRAIWEVDLGGSARWTKCNEPLRHLPVLQSTACPIAHHRLIPQPATHATQLIAPSGLFKAPLCLNSGLITSRACHNGHIIDLQWWWWRRTMPCLIWLIDYLRAHGACCCGRPEDSGRLVAGIQSISIKFLVKKMDPHISQTVSVFMSLMRSISVSISISLYFSVLISCVKIHTRKEAIGCGNEVGFWTNQVENSFLECPFCIRCTSAERNRVK